jgi:radical SAM protein with 4Fe4S-binding SPASM domain
LAEDYRLISQQVDALIDEDSGLCPVCDLGLEKSMPFSAKLSAPYRMDLALTYRCNNACAHCYNARPRNYPELDTQTWKKIIDRVWELRVPHVVFTGGEPTLREDLVELVAYAQEKGLVTGLNTNGRKLADSSFLQELIEAGLDHVQITVESYNPSVHDTMVRASGSWEETLAGLRNVVASKIYMMTNTTLLQNNAFELELILEFLAAEGVPTVGLNALIYSGHGKEVQTGLKECELPALLDIAQRITQAHGQRLIWYTPTQYCAFNPMQLSLGIKGCTAAYYNMCVESDGQVIPCQSYYQALGHILSDRWDSIWNHPLSRQLRERQDIPEGCRHCDFLVECGGGCPLAREHQCVSPIFTEVL